MRAAAARALGDMATSSDRHTAAAVARCLSDEVPAVRAAAVVSLGQLMGTEQLLAMGGCLADPSEEVRKVALQARCR